MAKMRSRSMDNDTETVIEFSQLFITSTSSTTNAFPTPSAPTTTTTTTAAVAAAAATKTVLSGSNHDDIRDYSYYCPPGWTATVISPGVGGGGVRPRVEGSQPSWPPFRRINNSGYYHL